MFLLLACAPRAPLPALAPEGVRGELAVEGPIAGRLAKSPADLVVFYGSEEKGSMETCGCPRRPRGSIARMDAYADAAAAEGVRVDAGYWLEDPTGFDGAARADVALMNDWMARGVLAAEIDALNASYVDLAGLAEMHRRSGALPPLPVVSANVTGPGLAKWVVVERGGRRVGITGITGRGMTLADTSAYTVADATSAGPVLDELAAQADVVVLLAYQAVEAARALVLQHPAVDVVIHAGQHREYLEPLLLGSTVWTWSHYQTMRLGELRLTLDGGAVRAALDRKIDLDPDMPDDPALLAMTREARTAIDAVQHELYGP